MNQYAGAGQFSNYIVEQWLDHAQEQGDLKVILYTQLPHHWK